jgi:hypothetical protein
MRRLVIGILSLAILAAGAIYLYSTFRVHQQLDRAASSLNQFGTLDWGSVWLDPRGQVIIRRIEFRPHGGPDAIRIDTLAIRSTNLDRMLELAPALNRGELPPRAGLSLSGLRLPMNPLLADLDMARLGLILPLRTRGCDEFEQLRLGDLLELDYGLLDLDAKLDYRVIDRRLTIEQTILTRQLSSIEQRFEIDYIEPIDGLDDLSALLQQGTLRTLDYSFEDLGLIERLDRNCAEFAELSPADRLDAHFQAWVRTWTDQGLAPTPIVQAGYRHYLEQSPTRLSIRFRPETPIPLPRLIDSAPASLVDDLNLAFSVGDGPDIELALDRVRSTRPAPVAVIEESNETEVEVTSPVGEPENPTIVVGQSPGWEQIEMSEAPGHLGDRARLRLADGSEVSGELISVSEEQIELRFRSRSGEFTRPIPRREVETIEVRP